MIARSRLAIAVVCLSLLAAACGTDLAEPPGSQARVSTPAITNPSDDPSPSSEATTPPTTIALGLDPQSLMDNYPTDSGSDGAMIAAGRAMMESEAMSDGGDTDSYEPSITESNTFSGDEPSGFVSRAADAQSTFALDVDTASYSIARRLITEGQLPAAASVRPEEFVNALDHDYPQPTGGDFAIGVDETTSPFHEHPIVRIGLQSRLIDEADRPPAHLTFMIDTSGSMDIRERLGLVKASLAVLVQNLRPTDTVAIVTFGSTASPDLEPTPVAETDTIVDAIQALSPEGSTNLEGGLRLAYEVAADNFVDGDINRVVLASDGVANVGRTGPGSLVELIRDDADDGIGLVTVGFGMGNFNDTLMEQLANDGDGFYAYVDTFEEAQRLFATELLSTLQTLALDAKIQATFSDTVSEYRLIGFENRAVADEDFRNDAVDAGEVGTGHDVTALYEVILDPAADCDEGCELGSVALRWETPDTGEVTEISEPLAFAATPWESAAPSLRIAVATAAFAEHLRGTGSSTDRGCLDVDADPLLEDEARSDDALCTTPYEPATVDPALLEQIADEASAAAAESQLEDGNEVADLARAAAQLAP